MPSNEVRTTRARYERIALASLSPYLSDPLPPTVCFSDTHFVPEPFPWSGDAPEDLLALLKALPDHNALSLGDLTEAAGIRNKQQLFACTRLEKLWDSFDRHSFRLILGNHDVGAEALLFQRFGHEQVSNGGFTIGAMQLCHGHEKARIETELLRWTGALVVPFYERAHQRFAKSPERLSNPSVLRSLESTAPFVLFGHSHTPALSLEDPTSAWANPGCFLRNAQSFLLLEEKSIGLYRRALQ